VVALVVSTLVTILLALGIVWYGRRRPVGAPLTWAEAMLAAAYCFFLAFLAYGVVPHQWLMLAENEWAWRGDRVVVGPGGILEPQALGGWLPFTLTYRVLGDTVAVVIYGIFLAAHVALFAIWQDRAKARPAADVVRSTYGRPLVKRG
jgi:uncharacterized membrane protein